MVDYESFYQRIDYDRLDPAPEVAWTSELRQTCAERWARLRKGKTGPRCPDWVFLQYLVEHEGLLLHGSQDPGIVAFEPRVAGNAFEDGRTSRVYASSSCQLAYWYAIVDREKLKQVCGAVKFGMIYAPVHPQTMVKGPRHFFHLSHVAFPHRPFRPGVVYILPRQPFSPEYLELQWYAEKSVAPLASVTVSPADWPMLPCVHALNWDLLPKDPRCKIPPFDTPEAFPAIGVMTWSRDE